ncbi:hypothetical protein [Billgrantia desiderata]|uniref:hypothetical protein n=1 Tax=Billgrantia desiderata TaxID=52021 RepID=UPI00089E2504|nr:hypothetical protein [Halomonas desiderata]SEF81855.1 hypothetical protein SAMN04487953_10695 [Halomonas desiderata]
MNKLHPVVINNPGKRSLSYRARDLAITALTLAVWLALIAKTIISIVSSDVWILTIATSLLPRVIALGFILTFLSFHCWAIYKRYLYHRRQKDRLGLHASRQSDAMA